MLICCHLQEWTREDKAVPDETLLAKVARIVPTVVFGSLRSSTMPKPAWEGGCDKMLEDDHDDALDVLAIDPTGTHNTLSTLTEGLT